MSDTTFTLELPDTVAQEVERLAREQGISTAEFLAQAAIARVDSVEAAAAFFAERAKRAKAGTAAKFFARKGGEQPRPGDEIK
jgi:predicted transcriptional regulator